jgi:hypothetical protein
MTYRNEICTEWKCAPSRRYFPPVSVLVVSFCLRPSPELFGYEDSRGGVAYKFRCRRFEIHNDKKLRLDVSSVTSSLIICFNVSSNAVDKTELPNTDKIISVHKSGCSCQSRHMWVHLSLSQRKPII